jgi:hypothetical protein
LFLPDNVKIIAGIILLVLYLLSYLAKRRTRQLERQRRINEVLHPGMQQPSTPPDIGWLGAFRRPELAPEQKARFRRRANVIAGAELILLGIVIPLGYGALTIMTFNSFDPAANWLVGACSVLCIAAGIFAMVRAK